MFQRYYNSLGVLESIYTCVDGINLPLSFNPENKTFDEHDPLVVALRSWEQKNGVLDLSDRELDPLTLEQAKTQKKQEIIAIAAAKQEELVAGFAPPEQASWTRKVAEAKAFLASGKLEDAPMLRAEAIALSGATADRVIAKYAQGLANKIVFKSETMYLDSAMLAGTRTKLLTQIEMAKTFEELNAINWEK